MRILADENFPSEAVDSLRSRGHDVVWIRTKAPGSSDQEVLARTVSDNRILITFDKDFGELVFHAKLPAFSGIVLFRISHSSPSRVAQSAVSVLESRTDWAGTSQWSMNTGCE